LIIAGLPMPSIKCTQVNTRTSRFGSEIPDATQKTVRSVHLAWLILGYSLPNTEFPGILSLSSNLNISPVVGLDPGGQIGTKGSTQSYVLGIRIYSSPGVKERNTHFC
jgi:hypothetical protein